MRSGAVRLRNRINAEFRTFFTSMPSRRLHGLRQPAAVFRQAACCETRIGRACRRFKGSLTRQ
jgi:hypothetical protein